MSQQFDALSVRVKAGLVCGESFWGSRSVARFGVDGATLTDGPHGVRYQRGDADHLGMMDGEPATSFLTGAAAGSTWDPALLEELGVALGAEASTLGPGVTIKRSPLCGTSPRTPALRRARRGVGTGLQSVGVGGSMKQFAANYQEADRMRVSAGLQ